MKYKGNGQFEGKQAKKRRGALLITFIAIVLLVAVLVVLSNSIKIRIPVVPTETVVDPTAESTEATEPAMQELSVSDLLKAVLTVKDDLEAAGEDMVNGEADAAREKLDGISEKTHSIRETLGLSMDALGDSMPSLKKELANIQEILKLVDIAVVKVMNPMTKQLNEHPFTNLKLEDGFDAKLLWDYLDFVEGLMPDIEEIVNLAATLDFSIVDSDGDYVEYLEKANELLEIYHEEPQLFSMLKSALGADSDRLYLIAAQNSAEIRASGGFPGSMGTLTITNGVIKVNEFDRVYDVIASFTPYDAGITPVETKLFHSGLSTPRDADFCPDFERVGYIFARGYEARNESTVDGVISMTPVIVQRLLNAIGSQVVLFDETVLDGTNATRILQSELYKKYFNGQYITIAREITDELFADAAMKTLDLVTDHVSGEDLMAYLEVVKESVEDRTLMLWAKDEAQENIIRKLGMSGGLNSDPEKPQAGVYYNCVMASKLGWYLEVETEIGKGTKNEDGSVTYPMEVTFFNSITTEEASSTHSFITAGAGGHFGGSAYFFAPAGGTVSDFKRDSGWEAIAMEEYNGLQLGYISYFSIPAQGTLTITYNLTTAPGVDVVPEISRTPTLQEYHY